jgi:uncharacterized protein YoxC
MLVEITSICDDLQTDCVATYLPLIQDIFKRISAAVSAHTCNGNGKPANDDDDEDDDDDDEKDVNCGGVDLKVEPSDITAANVQTLMQRLTHAQAMIAEVSTGTLTEMRKLQDVIAMHRGSEVNTKPGVSERARNPRAPETSYTSTRLGARRQDSDSNSDSDSDSPSVHDENVGNGSGNDGIGHLEPVMLSSAERSAMSTRKALLITLEGFLDKTSKCMSVLQSSLEDIERTVDAINASAYAKINARFSRYFADLVPGKYATLHPVSDDLKKGLKFCLTKGPSSVTENASRASHIPASQQEISTSKRSASQQNLRSVAELSGGQQALMALSLVFSCALHRGSPIYLFDEVRTRL